MNTADENISNLRVCIEDPIEDRMDSVTGAVWRIIEDVRTSYRLSMEFEGLDLGVVDTIQDTVRDYLERAYGD